MRPETRFIDFVLRYWPAICDRDLVITARIENICQSFSAFPTLENKFLAMEMDPGEGKTSLACLLWPAWMWTEAEKPETRFMVSVSRSEVAVSLRQRFCRLLDVLSVPYSSGSGSLVQTENGGSWLPFHLSSVLGHRCDVMVFDDAATGHPSLVDIYNSARVKISPGGGSVIVETPPGLISDIYGSLLPAPGNDSGDPATSE